MSEDKPKLPLSEISFAYLTVELNLPPSTFRRIGRVINAHAFVENAVTELLFETAQIDYSVGRVLIR